MYYKQYSMDIIVASDFVRYRLAHNVYHAFTATAERSALGAGQVGRTRLRSAREGADQSV